MYADPVAEILKPKDTQLVRAYDNSNSYRPKSIQSQRSYHSQQSSHLRPPSEQSRQSGKRVVQISRNGKKLEKFDQMNTLATQENAGCFDQEPLMLDQISLEDPIWRQILPDNMPVDQATLEKLVEDNPEYFYHYLGFCACYRCKCGRCRCDVSNQVKLKINGSFLSIYDKDFVQHRSSYNNLTPLNSLTYTTKFLDQKPIDLTTSHQYDYKEQALQTQENFKPPHRQNIGQMSNLTSYRTNYSNWGSNYQRFTRYPHISTSSDIKFIGRSSYQDSYCPPQSWKVDNPSIYKSNLSPLPTGPFVGLTTSQSNYRPFKVTHASQRSLVNKYETTPAFEGQFTSTGMKDFTQQNEDYCPAQQFKKMWRKKIAQKYEQKKDNFIQKRINAMKN